MHAKVADLGDNLLPSEAECLADLLFEIGKDLQHRGEYGQAAKWLERSHNVLAAQELDRLSQDAAELRLSIMHFLGVFKDLKPESFADCRLVRALLECKMEDSFEKAARFLSVMENARNLHLLALPCIDRIIGLQRQDGRLAPQTRYAV